MASPIHPIIPLQGGSNSSLESVAKILTLFSKDDYYAYERDGTYHIGIGSHAALILDPTGRTATVDCDRDSSSIEVKNNFKDVMRGFVTRHSAPGVKIFGQVGFNYAAYTRGYDFKPGSWPLCSLLVPRLQVDVTNDTVRLWNGTEQNFNLIKSALSNDLPSLDSYLVSKPDVTQNGKSFVKRVEDSLHEIDEGQYEKIILSRSVDVPHAIDVVGTLLRGRRSNTPKRTFSLSHLGFQATGFSPELVMSFQAGKVTTEPLAGTRSNVGTDEERLRLRNELLKDPKEIVEHIISVKEAIREMDQISSPGTVVVEDLMSIRERGKVQHLGSTVTGILSPEKDCWDAFHVLFPSITAVGIPKSKAIEAIIRQEDYPRELYSGAVLLLDGSTLFEASLVLRTAFQDPDRRWLQAGAGVISMSNAGRELAETCEKLQSIAPFVVAKKC